MSYSFNALHFWNRAKIFYKFHIYNFYFCWDLNKLQLVWLEVEYEVFRVRFALYIYFFAYVNGCIVASVVEARTCNLWDLVSSPSGTLLHFSHIFIFDLFLFGRRWALWAWLILFFWLIDSHTGSWHPLAQLYLFVYLFHFFSF